MKAVSYFSVFKELICSDLVIFRQTLVDKCIDLTIWVVLTILVTSYIMPYFGLAADFGMFQLGGVLAAIGLFEVYSSAVDLVSDFEGDRIINYRLTLPIPSWLAILSKAAYFFIVYSVLTILMVPIGKLCLWNQFDLMQVNYLKFPLAIIFQNAYYACFGLWAGSVIANMSKLGSVWARFIFPMWFMGGFQFSWQALHAVSPVVAYVNLINPMIYITESTRASMLGQTGYINFWLCLLAIGVFIIACFALALRNLRKRLDFV